MEDILNEYCIYYYTINDYKYNKYPEIRLFYKKNLYYF